MLRRALFYGAVRRTAVRISPLFPSRFGGAQAEHKPQPQVNEAMDLHEHSMIDRPELLAKHAEMTNLYRHHFGQDVDPDLPRGELPVYTLDEVAEHRTIDDCWIILDGMVFDITNYVRHHPGGAVAIKPYFGADATKPYHDQIHTGKAHEMRKTWCIGRVAKAGEESKHGPLIEHEFLPLQYADESDGVRRPDSMFCMQCSQTKHGTGCTTAGVCGKQPETAVLQDVLLHHLSGIGALSRFLVAHGKRDLVFPPKTPGPDADPRTRLASEIAEWLPMAVFSTLTNVNYDPDRFYAYVHMAQVAQALLRQFIQESGLTPDETITAAGTRFDYPKASADAAAAAAKAGTPLEEVGRKFGESGLATKEHKQTVLDAGEKIGVQPRRKAAPDLGAAGLREMVLYGLKGVCAYYDHALIVGKHHKVTRTREEEGDFYLELSRLLAVATEPVGTVDEMIQANMDTGKLAFRSMQLLDAAHNEAFGTPTPTVVRTTPRPGRPCVLVSGHDIPDLRNVLEAAKDRGVDVYTHGELLPAHGYPKIREYENMWGNFGRAWYRQQTDFELFPGPIVMTSNCMTPPKESYAQRLYTKSAVGWAGVTHLHDDDFTKVIDHAIELGGFTEEAVKALPHRIAGNDVTVGFGHKTIVGMADKILGAMKDGKLKHIFVIGGCNGWEPERSYYPQLASKLPKESVILTVGCKQYKFRNLDLGQLGGTDIPRILSAGQCNDAYSTIIVAVKLAEALGCGVNELPLHISLGWMEQKAVCILQACLSLGLLNIKSGPIPPAFLTPEVRAVLKARLGWEAIADVKSDLEQTLARIGA